jgi:AcrR family transcriptional regulator
MAVAVASPAVIPPRATQQQRRARTMSLVVDAAIAALAEVGYAGTSVTEIGARSGVSQGGMFRHFPTRLDVVIAAAEAITIRQITTYRGELDRADGSLRDLLEFTRAASRTPDNAAWQELLTAARSDRALRERLAPIVGAYREHIVALARDQSVLADVPTIVLAPIVLTIVQAFDGEALAGAVLPQPEHDELRIQLLEAMLGGLLHP